MTKICIRCKAENPGDATYCKLCQRKMLPPEWLCPKCHNRCFTFPYSFDETLYKCPFCQRRFRKEPDGTLAPVSEEEVAR